MSIYEHSKVFLTCRLLIKDVVLHAGRISARGAVSLLITLIREINYGIMVRIYDGYVPLHKLSHVQRSLC